MVCLAMAAPQPLSRSAMPQTRSNPTIWLHSKAPFHHLLSTTSPVIPAVLFLPFLQEHCRSNPPTKSSALPPLLPGNPFLCYRTPPSRHFTNKPVSTGSSIEHAGKGIYLRDVRLFVLERVKDLAATKGANLVQGIPRMSSRGTALEWWTAELSATEKRITKLGDSVEE